MKAALKNTLTITEVSKVVEPSLLTKRDLRQLLNVPDSLTQNQNVNELELYFYTKIYRISSIICYTNVVEFS